MLLHFYVLVAARDKKLRLIHKAEPEIRDEWPSSPASHSFCGESGHATQPVPLASLKLSMAVYGQKLDGRLSR